MSAEYDQIMSKRGKVKNAYLTDTLLDEVQSRIERAQYTVDKRDRAVRIALNDLADALTNYRKVMDQ